MRDNRATDSMSSVAADTDAAAAWPDALLHRAMTPDLTAQAAAFGHWWYDVDRAQMLLSREAAVVLDKHPGLHMDMDALFSGVLPEDLVVLPGRQVFDASITSAPRTFEFRVLSKTDGLRWLRLVAWRLEPGTTGKIEGILSDVSALRYGALREEFCLASTQLMIGTHTLDEAVSRMIKLVCTDLGWECGMYWAYQADGPEGARLVCSQPWIAAARPQADLPAPLRQHMSVAVGKGVVGNVWSSGEARWIEDVAKELHSVYAESARQMGIRSAYAFPVTYENDDGTRHRPGVLIFFSRQARQRTARLPHLSAAIGGVIAQTARHMVQQESIRELAQIDTLSGLANRGHFHDLLDSACTARRGAAIGVLYIDLDRLKPINEGLGHAAGDVVLRQFAQRLAALVPAGAQVGRVGGDEFALFMHLAESPDDVQDDVAARLHDMGQQVLQAARASFFVDGRELAISASVGISLFPQNARSADDLIRHAYTAMHRVKRGGRNAVGFFAEVRPETHAEAQHALMQQLTVEAELVHALAGDQLFMEYQPVFDVDSRRIRAVEGLIRWRHPSGEVVRPDIFIPIAEQSHLIVDIGRWVIRHASRDLATLHAAGLVGVQLNVNMAAREFLNANLPAELAEVTREAGIDPGHVCLELTEGMMMSHAEQAIPVMHTLREHGFRISIDDFGMGYSSLSRLKDLPISSLKIDRSFVRDLPGAHQDRAIVQTIIDIGRNMQLDVIAEGVETVAQLGYLRQLGCTLVQGYLTGRPMSLGDLIRIHAKSPYPSGNQQLA